MRLRSQYDGEILKLAVPALGALAAEPLYLLVDTAIVGHLGRPQLAALGVAAIVLSGVFGVFNFLQYGTTAQVGRASGAGEAKVANRLGAQALWLSLGFGVPIAAGVIALAPQIVDLMGVEGDTADFAVTYMRIASLGLPFAFLALGGQGYLRGVADLRTPLVIVIAANVANLALEVLFVYGFGWGIEGSAWGTVIAQAGMGAAFIVVILRAVRGDTRPSLELMRRLLVIGRYIFVRTAALLSAFTLAGAAIARFGDASLAAHQIAFQLWIFLALVLDAVAIAGQVIVGRGLGAGDTERAYAASVRMIWLSVYAGVDLRRRDACPRGRAALCLHERRAGDRAGAGDLASVRADAAAERGRLCARRDPDRRQRRPLPDVVDGVRIRGVRARLACRYRVRLGNRRGLVCPLRPDLRPARVDAVALPWPPLAGNRLGLSVSPSGASARGAPRR